MSMDLENVSNMSKHKEIVPRNIILLFSLQYLVLDTQYTKEYSYHYVFHIVSYNLQAAIHL